MSEQVSKKRFEKHLRIGIRFDGDRIVLLDGSPLPALSKNAVAELIVAPEAILDSVARARFLEGRAIQILERDSHVFFGVSPTMVGSLRADGLLSSLVLEINSDYWFVEGKLEAPLMLQVRGDQEARLSSCSCTIPSLNTTADSLNHAFSLISVAFETKRRSHSEMYLNASTHKSPRVNGRLSTRSGSPQSRNCRRTRRIPRCSRQVETVTS